MSYFTRYLETERELLNTFCSDTVLERFSGLSDTDFRNFLLERRQLSVLGFTPMYDAAECVISDAGLLNVVRDIRQEEYPIRRASHRVDTVTDLLRCGLSLSQISSYRPSVRTIETVLACQQMFVYYSEETFTSTLLPLESRKRGACDDTATNILHESDVGLLVGKGNAEVKKCNERLADIGYAVSLRLAGEALVAVSYDLILSEIERRGWLPRAESVFYQPHVEHDSVDGGSHSDKLGGFLQRAIVDETGLEVAVVAAKNAYSIRKGFYEQF